MNRIIRAVTAFACLGATTAFAQNSDPKEKAIGLFKEAIELMDRHQEDQAVRLLQEARKLNPADSFLYDYETGYAYYTKKDYKNAIALYTRLTTHPKATDQVYMMLGNAYDDNGDEKMALKTYGDGLKKFPNSGKLLMETGNVSFKNKKLNDALDYYELGIEKEPGFASNYYRAARLFLLGTEEEVWGMLYGELFMNLERNSERTQEMSKWLYDTYRSEIKRTSPTEWSVSFSASNTIDAAKLKKGETPKLPFPLMAYEPVMGMAVAGIDSLDMEGICKLRTHFLDGYYQMKMNEKYPNILFEYQREIQKAGHFNAYNHWVLLNGDQSAFLKWQKAHVPEWEKFVSWFLEHPVKIDAQHKFARSQYQ